MSDEEEHFHSGTDVEGERENSSQSNSSYNSGDTTSRAQGTPTLQSLGVTFMEQDSLERKVAADADKAMVARDIELDERRLEKSQTKYKKFESKLGSLQTKLDNGSTRISEKQKLRIEIDNLNKHEIGPLLRDIQEIKQRLKESRKAAHETDNSSVHRLPEETKQEFLIRTGKITAFGSANGFVHNDNIKEQHPAPTHQNLIGPGLEEFDEDGSNVDLVGNDDIPKYQKMITISESGSDVESEPSDDDDYQDAPTISKSKKSRKTGDEDDEYEDVIDIAEDSEDETAENLIISDDETVVEPKSKRKSKSKKEDELKNIDDGDESFYQKRLNQWVNKRSSLRTTKRKDYVDDPETLEWLKPHPTVDDAILNDQFRIPGDIYPSLFDYQKTGVQWLWELYSQRTGGIIGDEMGLGKTVQVISFLAGLHYSGKLNRPVLIVCPATVLNQWCNEFHRWWPAFRVVILHSIGTGMSGKKKKRSSGYDSEEEESLDALLSNEEYGNKSAHALQTDRYAQRLIDKIVNKGHIIITTYVGVRIYSRFLQPVKWGYVVLDEGHKIRNPDSFITLMCKQLKTPNRIILSGTPIQNNLVELWSLFDFVFPGRLGTLPVFQKQFSIPINLGGYANATNVQVQTGYKCAVILRDLVSPYLLRRVKADVAKDLPKKSEMVLFCKLTRQQRTLYRDFLESEDLKKILNGKRNALYGIDVLRKICNHPDLVDLSIKGKLKPNGESSKIQERSGKMLVVAMLLELWQKEGRKTLIFSQTRQMLDILQEFMDALIKESENNYKYLRMDGTTPIGQRQMLVDTFNNDPEYSVFLLTTRVGGLGVNLTGASRVIIYDPDWNPSTDLQARERAWRLGQKKDVTIYRLMIAGSIEEKIYHRQIFKQFLTNKILKDPKQKRFFKMNDLYDLFTLGDQDTQGTETADLFGASETNYEGTKERRSRLLKNRLDSPRKHNKGEDDFLQVSRIKGVSSLQKFEDGESNDEGKDKGEDGDLMSSLFKKSGIHSALEHDSIMQQGTSTGTTATSYNLIENEASRIANEAVNALRESRKLTKMTGIGVPTWTGKFGHAGKSTRSNHKRRLLDRSVTPKSRSTSPLVLPSGPISSSSILAGIQKKKKDTGTLRKKNTVSNINTKDLVTELSSYMSGVEGFFSTSHDVLDHLNIDVCNEKNVEVIRSMLLTICKWDKQRKGWVLNDEFK